MRSDMDRNRLSRPADQDVGFLIEDAQISEGDDARSTPPWSPQNPVRLPGQTMQYVPNSPNASEAGTALSNRQARPQQQRRTASTSNVPALPMTEQGHSMSTFDPPPRSIFASGPPTSSISANTALASLSAATISNSTGPLAALTNAGSGRRSQSKLVDSSTSIIRESHASRATLLDSEKDIDDPDATSGAGNVEIGPSSTSATLARLFVTSDGTTPISVSRNASHFHSTSRVGRSMNDAPTLTSHLFHYGLMEGRHSDITVHAFGESYKLHKLLLDRVPFFSSAFSGSWAESSAREMRLYPGDTDANITKLAFELALKRIYGTNSPAQEEQESIGLFATACWLDMSDLVDSCVECILQQMNASNLRELIKLVTSNYYGKAGGRILSSAKAMLCREGWEMPYECWDGIPSEVIREIIGGDPFFIPSEWERWFLTVKLLNRRLKANAIEAGLVSSTGRYLLSKPTSLRFFAIRFDATYRRNSSLSNPRHLLDKDESWLALYTSPDVTPLLVLLDEGIHYVHLRFEQLQQIRAHKDIFGVPILPENVISDALWMSMELRQRVLNAHESDLELGLSEMAEEYEEMQPMISSETTESMKGKRREELEDASFDHDIESDSWDCNGKPRKFWIPSNDISCVLGGTREAYAAGNATSGAEWSSSAARLSASLEPTDATWASDFVYENGRPLSGNLSSFSAPRYTFFPPFRFSAEFPNPRTLKEKKRVYSQTVWYAGSMWNLYIQRVNTSKSQQLGIYLHRAKDKDPSDDPLAQFIPATVDDRIGQLEREMLLRKNERRNRQWQTPNPARSSEDEPPTTSSPRDFDLAMLAENVQPIDPTLRSNFTPANTIAAAPTFDSSEDSSSNVARKISHTPTQSNNSTKPRRPPAPMHSRSSSATLLQLLDSDEEDEELLRTNRRYAVPAISAYLDSRPVIKTYFKIYSPDKAGRLLSIYESAPEKFVVSKSWGWKSSQMVLDERLVGPGVNGASGGGGGHSTRDGKLRYMVTIGNV